MGKAFLEAGRQAVKSSPTVFAPCPTANTILLDAKSSPQAAMGTDSAGVGSATSGSPTDLLTREHRMTFDEAQLILNAKRGDTVEAILKACVILLRHRQDSYPFYSEL